VVVATKDTAPAGADVSSRKNMTLLEKQEIKLGGYDGLLLSKG